MLQLGSVFSQATIGRYDELSLSIPTFVGFPLEMRSSTGEVQYVLVDHHPKEAHELQSVSTVDFFIRSWVLIHSDGKGVLTYGRLPRNLTRDLERAVSQDGGVKLIRITLDRVRTSIRAFESQLNLLS